MVDGWKRLHKSEDLKTNILQRLVAQITNITKKHRKEKKNKIGSNGLDAKSDIGVRVGHLNCNVNGNLGELRKKIKILNSD